MRRAAPDNAEARSAMVAILDELRGPLKPDSLQALADRTGRAKSNLSRTLKTMERYGLVRLERHGGRTIAPRATADRISVDLGFQTAA